MSTPADPLLQAAGHLDAAAHDDHVDILRRPLKKNVAHIAAHHIALHAQLVGGLAYLMKNLTVENLCQLGIGI